MLLLEGVVETDVVSAKAEDRHCDPTFAMVGVNSAMVGPNWPKKDEKAV